MASSRRHTLPLAVGAVCAVWGVYWFPGIPLALVQGAKYAALFGMFAVALVSARRSRGQSWRVSRATTWWLVAVVLAALPGVLFSPEPAESVRVWVRYPVALLVYLALRQVYGRNPLWVASAAKLLVIPVLLSVACVGLARIGVAHLEPPESFVRSYGSEAYLMGLSYRTSGLAWAIAFVAPVMAFYAFRARTLARRAAWAAGLVACLGVDFALMNRGGLLSALLASVLVGFFLARSRAVRWGLLLLSVPLIGYAALRVTSSGVFEERSHAWERVMAGRGGATELDKLSSGRYGRYTTALAIIARYPLTGIGFREADDDYGLTSAQAHNLYLSVSLGAGALAGLTVALFFGRVALLWLEVGKRLLARCLHPFAVVPLAMLVPHVVATLVESGPMFTSLYAGISFWFALPALELLLVLPRGAEPRGRGASRPAGMPGVQA